MMLFPIPLCLCLCSSGNGTRCWLWSVLCSELLLRWLMKRNLYDIQYHLCTPVTQARTSALTWLLRVVRRCVLDAKPNGKTTAAVAIALPCNDEPDFWGASLLSLRPWCFWCRNYESDIELIFCLSAALRCYQLITSTLFERGKKKCSHALLSVCPSIRYAQGDLHMINITKILLKICIEYVLVSNPRKNIGSSHTNSLIIK